jgi:anti-anti-sigma factor
VLIKVIGEVDTFTAPALELCLTSQASQRGVCQLIVDMSQVTFLGAAAVSVLAQAQRQCRLRGTRLLLRSGGRRHVLLPLQLIGLTELASIEVELERKEDLQRRIGGPRRTCRFDQLALSVKCGSSSTVEGNPVTCDEQAARLGLIVETFAEVWG